MTFFEYLVALRTDVLAILGGVKNANGVFGWDTTQPNYVAKHQLERLLEKYIELAQERGVYVVTRYSSCNNPRHSVYPTEDRYGLSIKYQDRRFVWEGDQLYQGARESTCPCSRSNTSNRNYVIDDLIYSPSSNLAECRIVSSILSALHRAFCRAGNNRTRSGIREALLLVVLQINDAILPEPIEEYISKKRAASA